MTSQPALMELNQKFTQWSSRIEQNKLELEEELNRWKGYKEDYDALGKQLETLADETSRPAMIPFGSLAFMPGKLIHTNEITVYLGDQYYVERSTKQALGILNRRKEGVNENLALVQAQWNAIEAKSTTATNNKNLFPSSEGVNDEGLPIMEIREEIPDDPVGDTTTMNDIATSSSSSVPPAKPAAPAAPATTSELSNDLMSMLDALEQEEEEEEREKQQQLMEEQLTFDTEDDGQKDIDYDDEDLDDLYDTEVADTMFDHFEDDEEYATQGVVEQEDATIHEEEEGDDEEEQSVEELIKDVVAEHSEQVTQATSASSPPPPPPPPIASEPAPVVSSVTENPKSSPHAPKEKKLSKFKQLQLEKQQQPEQQQSDTVTKDHPKSPTTTNKMPKFKVQKPAERKRKQQQSPPTIASSSSLSSPSPPPSSSILPPTTSDETVNIPPVISSKPVESNENQQQQQQEQPSSPPKKKISKFKQFQEQQRQGSTSGASTTRTTSKSNTVQSKGTPITVPSKHTPITIPTKKTDESPQPVSSTSTNSKKKVSFGATTSVREHDRLASPQTNPQGVYSQPLKEEAAIHSSSNSNTLQHTIRSPSDIFRVVKLHQPKLEEDGYPVLEEESNNNNNNDGDEVDTVNLRDLATTIQDTEPMFRPNYDVDEDQLPSLHPWRKPTGGPSSLVQSKSKMDTNTMRGAVLEREAEDLDMDQVEDDMDFKEIKSSYQRQRQNMLATMGGLSFDPKPEFEVFDEDLPLPSKDGKKNDDDEVVVVDLPKKMSRFKAARMGLAPTTEQ